MTNALAYIESIAWAITIEHYEILRDRAARIDVDDFEAAAKRISAALEKREETTHKLEAVMTRQGKLLDGSKSVIVRPDAPGVAIIPVIGAIYRYANIFSMYCGGTSIDFLAQDIRAAKDNPDINSALFYFDSPGGEFNGCNEQANLIAEFPKPSVGYIAGHCCSGALWLASGMDERVTDAGGTLGSVGVVMSTSDEREQAKQRGRILLVSSDAENKRPDLSTEAGRAELQKIVDAYAKVFRSSIARNYGISEDDVISRFNRGGVLIGQAAIEAGLADRLGSFEQVLSEMSAGKKRKKMRAAASEFIKPEAGENNGGKGMSDKKSFIASLFSGWSKEDKQAALATLSEDGKPPAATTPPPDRSSAAAQPPAQAEESEQMRGLRAQIQTERNARIRSEAVAFAEGEILVHRALPAEKEAIVALFTQAANDDANHPSKVAFAVVTADAEGKPVKQAKEGTRVEALRATYAARPSHNFTRELIAFDEEGMRELSSSSSSKDEIESARKSARAYAEKQNRTSSKSVN